MNQQRALGAASVFFVALFAAGCGDDLPTATGPERFPTEARLTSFTWDFPGAEFLEPLGAFDGYSTPRNLPYLVVANQFDGGVNARTLIRTVDWPETILNDTAFTYVGGSLVMNVDTLGSTSDGAVILRVYELNQEWHPRTATWEMAVDTVGEQVPWTQPGAELGRLVTSRTWAETLEHPDSLIWQLDSLSVARMSEPDFPGVVIVADGVPARVQLTGFTVRADVRLSTQPDTIVQHTIPGGEGAYIFDRAPPTPGDEPGWLIGGLTSARALFRLTLPQTLPSCGPGGGPCPDVPISEVELNDVSVMLTPRRVQGGFGEVSGMTLRLRSVGSPELGALAPLGPVTFATPGAFSQVVSPEGVFRHPPADTALAMRLTEEAIRRVQQANGGQVVLPLALLAEPEGGYFGYARFDAEPRLRIVYTLPAQQTVQ